MIILAYSPFETGLPWLPFSVGIVLSAGITSNLVAKIRPRVLFATGMLIAAGGSVLLSMLGRETSYFVQIMPAIFATAFGFAMSFVLMALAAVSNVRTEAGIASALFNSAQQIGTPLGLAVLSTVAVKTTQTKVPDALATLHQGRSTGNMDLVNSATDALVHGYSTALLVGAVILAVAAVISAIAINAKPSQSMGRGR